MTAGPEIEIKLRNDPVITHLKIRVCGFLNGTRPIISSVPPVEGQSFKITPAFGRERAV